MNADRWIKDIYEDRAVHFMPIVFYPAALQMGYRADELVREGGARRMADVMTGIIEAFPEIEFAQTALDVTVDPEVFGCPVMYDRDAPPHIIGAVVNRKGEGLESLADPGPHTPRQDLHYEAIRLAKKKMPGKPVFGNLLAPFTMAISVMPLKDAMICTIKRGGIMCRVLDKCLEHVLARAEAYKEAGADGLILDEMGGSIIPPGQNAEFSSAYVRQVVDAVQTPDFPILLHNCGNVVPMIDTVFETGCRIYSFGNGSDLVPILKKAPEDCLITGNMDPMHLVKYAPEDVYSETTAILEACAPYPQFVLAPGCDMAPATKKENVTAMIRAMKDFNEKNS